MRVIDAGHAYELRHLDGDGASVLSFVKREGPGYPRNVGAHEGTTLQEVLRALIDRVQYLDGQIKDARNEEVIEHLRRAILSLEIRAAERHGRSLNLDRADFMRLPAGIETLPVCPKCLHIGCAGACRAGKS